MYLGTGEPDIASLVPNRMLRNVDGLRFFDISACSGTAHLQKGHGVSCGDWDNDGDADIMIEMGGAIDGDRYHNIMFQNPGHANRYIKVKLGGVKSNRAAIGARIKVTTDDPDVPEVHRLVSSGSSFGANSLSQVIGLRDATKILKLEIDWPATGIHQVFESLPVDAYYEISETDSRSLQYISRQSRCQRSDADQK